MENTSVAGISDIKIEANVLDYEVMLKDLEEIPRLNKKAFEYKRREYQLNEIIKNRSNGILTRHPKAIKINEPGKINNYIIGIETC